MTPTLQFTIWCASLACLSPAHCFKVGTASGAYIQTWVEGFFSWAPLPKFNRMVEFVYCSSFIVRRFFVDIGRWTIVHVTVDIYGLTGIYSIVQKGHKKDQNSPMETTLAILELFCPNWNATLQINKGLITNCSKIEHYSFHTNLLFS